MYVIHALPVGIKCDAPIRMIRLTSRQRTRRAYFFGIISYNSLPNIYMLFLIKKIRCNMGVFQEVVYCFMKWEFFFRKIGNFCVDFREGICGRNWKCIPLSWFNKHILRSSVIQFYIPIRCWINVDIFIYVSQPYNYGNMAKIHFRTFPTLPFYLRIYTTKINVVYFVYVWWYWFEINHTSIIKLIPNWKGSCFFLLQICIRQSFVKSVTVKKRHYKKASL